MIGIAALVDPRMLIEVEAVAYRPGRMRVTVAVRVIPCLDVDAGRVVKGINFAGLRDAGDPVELAAAYDAQGADELVFLDITASSSGRETMYEVVRRTAEQVFIPLTVGGGVRTARRGPAAARGRGQGVAEHRRRGQAGTAGRGGAAVRLECVVLSVDARRAPAAGLPSGFEVTTHGGRRGTGIDAVAWASRAAGLGAGEILLNSMDADGTKAGFDTEMIRAVRAAVDRPGHRQRRGRGTGSLPARGRRGRGRGAGRQRVPLRQLRIADVKAALRAAGQLRAVPPGRARGPPARRWRPRQAAPTMPASLCMVAGTTLAGSFSAAAGICPTSCSPRRPR